MQRERKLTAALERYFARLAAVVRDRLSREGALAAADDLFHPRGWDALLRATVAPHFRGAAVRGARDVLAGVLPAKRAAWRKQDGEAEDDEAGLPAEVAAAVQAAVVRALGESYWEGINDSVRDAVAAAIAAGVAGGLSAEEIRREVLRVLGPSARHERALRVAVSEITAALNLGSLQGIVYLAGLGLVRLKRWQSMEDLRVRESHYYANGQTVPAGEAFVVGGERGMYPGDPAFSPRQRVHCRCRLVAVAVGDEAGPAVAGGAEPE